MSATTALVMPVGLLAVTAAQASALEAPSGLAADLGSSSSEIPVFSWDRVPGATGYRIEIDDNDTFTSLFKGVDTANDTYVPDAQVPSGKKFFWRVRAANGAEWTYSDVTRPALSAPSVTAPAQGAHFVAPDNPPTFVWEPVSGATTYQVRVSTANSSECESGVVGSWTSQSTKFVVADTILAPSALYYWCVRAQLPNSVNSEWTTARAFQVDPLAVPYRRSPVNNEIVQEVVLDWDPVPGAASYDLQIGTDQYFTTNVVESVSVKSTRYSPKQTLDNRTWYWRVRARDAKGNYQQWDELAANEYSWFVRRWTEQAHLEWPLPNSTVPFDELYYQWSPVPLAERYRLETSTTSDFSSPLKTCTTVHTTFVGACGASKDVRTWWRVYAVETTKGVADGGVWVHDTLTETLVMERRVFTYQAPQIEKTWPLDGGNVDAATVPTLQWNPVAGVDRYKVTLTPQGGSVNSYETTATSFTPRTRLPAGLVTWDVQPITADDEVWPATSPSTFTVEPFAVTGTTGPPSLTNSGVESYRPPTLTWAPVTDATHYVLKIRSSAAPAQQVNEKFEYPAGEDRTTAFLAPGTYEWTVIPYDGATALTASAPGSFTILDPRVDWNRNTQYLAALSGNAMFGHAGEPIDRCTAQIDPATCVNLRQTPVLHWAPAAGAENPNISHYILSLYSDANFATPVPGYTDITVLGNTWLPTETLPDAQAGQQGETSSYYWYLRPCVYDPCKTTVGAPLNHAFNKMANQPTLKSPVSTSAPERDPDVVVTNDGGEPAGEAFNNDNDVVFAWDDYLDSQARAAVTSSSLQNSHSEVSAEKYDLMYATNSAFTNATTVTDIDQKVYTPGNILPDGNIFWKVRAYDGSGRALNWSEAARFTHVSPAPAHLVPGAEGAVISGRQALSWDSVPYASQYKVEIYSGGVPVGSSTTNRTVNASTYSTQYTSSSLLAPGEYTWRARGVDANGQDLRWSNACPAVNPPADCDATNDSRWGHFTVAPDKPALHDPAVGAKVAPQDLFFSWGPVDGANNYRVEWQPVGSSNTPASAKTPALAYGFPGTITTAGDYRWRVVALRDNSDWKGSDWSTFHVVLGPVAEERTGLSGDGAVGTTLTVVPPTWSMPQAVTTYQWLLASKAINGATGPTYNIAPGDAGKKISVTATGTVPGYNPGTSTSPEVTAAAGAPPEPRTATRIAGDPKVGLTLSVTAAPTWDLDGVANSYTWRRGATTVGTGQTYVVKAADVGGALTVDAKGELAGYGDGHSFSNTLVAVTGDAAVGTEPVIAGSSAVGSTLTIQAPATWTRYEAPLPSGSSTKYQWLRDGVAIASATATTYKLAAADAGHAVSLRVSLVQSGYDTGVVLSSNAIGAETGPAPAVSVLPTVTGTPTLGTKLGSSRGTWSTNGTFTYQWRRDGAPIPAARASTYTLTLADVGHAVSVSVTNTVAGRAPGSATSAAVAIPKVASKASLSLKSTKVKRKKKVTVTVTITASRVTSPTGTIQILAKGKVIATKTLSAAGKGKLTFKVTAPKKKGKYAITVRYLGSGTTAGSRSTAVKLKVT